MPWLLLLLLGGLAVVGGAEGKKVAKVRPMPGLLRGRAVLSQRLGAAFSTSPLVTLFGEGTEDEYPAPYRHEDARAIAQIVLDASSETSTKLWPEFEMLVDRVRQIDAAQLPPWRKTYALIMTIIVPAFAANMLWHWYRPTSNTKIDRFNSITAWAGLFFTLPATATAAITISSPVHSSSLLAGGMAAYLNPVAPLRRGDLNSSEMRRALYDLFHWVAQWPKVQPQYGGGEQVDETIAHANARMADLNSVYPLSDPERYILEGNLKAVDELIWLFNARVQSSVSVDFDEGAAIAALVVKVIAVVVSAVAPMVGSEIGAALTTASSALSTLSALVADGEISAPEFQALTGAGAAFMLDQAGIHLGLQDEMKQLGQLVE